MGIEKHGRRLPRYHPRPAQALYPRQHDAEDRVSVKRSGEESEDVMAGKEHQQRNAERRNDRPAAYAISAADHADDHGEQKHAGYAEGKILLAERKANPGEGEFEHMNFRQRPHLFEHQRRQDQHPAVVDEQGRHRRPEHDNQQKQVVPVAPRTTCCAASLPIWLFYPHISEFPPVRPHHAALPKMGRK